MFTLQLVLFYQKEMSPRGGHRKGRLGPVIRWSSDVCLCVFESEVNQDKTGCQVT